MPFEFWYEFASTYSYVAASRIERVATAADVTVEWRPFLLGPIFAQWEWKDSPFNIYPEKGRYMWRDLERLCDAAEIPFTKPSQFPRNGLLAARVALIAAPEGWCPQFSRAVFQANFANDRDISSWDTISELVASVGRAPDEIYDRALAADNKAHLKRQTEDALGLGIFGAPTFVVGRELFWGNDRMEQAIAWQHDESG